MNSPQASYARQRRYTVVLWRMTTPDINITSMVSRAAPCFAACLLLAATWSLQARAQMDADRTVRIRLFDGQDVTRAVLRAAGGTLRITTGDDASALARLDPDEQVTVSTRGGDVALQLGQNGLYAETLHVQPADGARWSITPDGGNTRTYAGTLTVQTEPTTPNALQLVNVVPLEDYVESVVSSEYTLDDQEGTKAMAVVARTYALRASAAADRTYDHVDHVGAQVYRGSDTITPAARAATEATRGEVLTYDDRLLRAVYSASSGGHTADNEDVWDTAEVLPYLRGKPDPYDTNSPHANWRASIPREMLLKALSEHHGRTVEGFHLGPKSEGGRVQTIELLVSDGPSPEISANDFRLFVNRTIPGVRLKSTLFDARRQGDRYIFEGHGFGHGVGLSQWGAHEMAERGHSYRDILSFYYTDVEISTLEEIGTPALAPPTRIASSEEETPEPQRETVQQQETVRRIGW